MNRREALAAILAGAGEAAIVAMLGFVSRDVHDMADRPNHMYLLSSMGLAIPVAVGVALSHRGHTVAIEGDGSVLMNLGALATVARYAPPTFCAVILDNGVYETTGSQPTASRTADLAAVARGCGIARVVEVATADVLESAVGASRDDGGSPMVIVARVEPGGTPGPWILEPPPALAERFQGWLAARGVSSPDALTRADRSS